MIIVLHLCKHNLESTVFIFKKWPTNFDCVDIIDYILVSDVVILEHCLCIINDMVTVFTRSSFSRDRVYDTVHHLIVIFFHLFNLI